VGVEEYLKEALALWGQRQKIRLLKADSGFFEDQLLSFLEQRQLPYIVVARLSKWVKREAQHVAEWRQLDGDFAVGEFRLKLPGWQVERRLVVIRERVRESRDRVGRKAPSVFSFSTAGGKAGFLSTLMTRGTGFPGALRALRKKEKAGLCHSFPP
jgi:hypothetical protein